MINGAYYNIFKGKEDNYSSVIAQALLLSSEFRNKFFSLSNVEEILKDSELVKICTNYHFKNRIENEIGGRIDIWCETKSGYHIGIENKKYAELQPNQLKRYIDSLSLECKEKHFLFFLTPDDRFTKSTHPKTFELIYENQNIIHITYKDVSKIIHNLIANDSKNTFLRYLNDYIKDFIISPITQVELLNLGKRDLRVKFQKILRQVNIDAIIGDEKVGEVFSSEYQSGKYVLNKIVFRFYEIFFGLNIGAIPWYLQNQIKEVKSPSLVAYLKNSSDHSIDLRLIAMAQEITQSDGLKSDKWDNNIFTVGESKKEAARILLSCSIDEFIDSNKQIEEIVERIEDMTLALLKAIAKT